MPAKIFETEFDRAKDKVISKTVEEAGGIATKFWLSHFEKKMRNQETQTISMDEIMQDAEKKATMY